MLFRRPRAHCIGSGEDADDGCPHSCGEMHWAGIIRQYARAAFEHRGKFEDARLARQVDHPRRWHKTVNQAFELRREFGFSLSPKQNRRSAKPSDCFGRHDRKLFDRPALRHPTRAGMNLHINLAYGENEHHVIESIFKGVGRALDVATGRDDRISSVRSSKGVL